MAMSNGQALCTSAHCAISARIGRMHMIHVHMHKSHTVSYWLSQSGAVQ